jgi:hypothetical protein
MSASLAGRAPASRLHQLAADIADHVWTLEEIAALLD